MLPYPVWAQALNISEEKWTEWSATHPSAADILFWGLTHEQISWCDYREWSKNHYGLCTLDDSYFQMEDTINEELKTYLELSSWSPWCQPLYAWDDVVYIACLEPQDLPATPSKSFISVICSPWQLENRWEKIKGMTEGSKPQDSLPDMPAGIIMNPPKVHLSIGSDPSSPPESKFPEQGDLSITKNAASIHLTKFNYEAQPQNATSETYDFGPISIQEAPQDINPDLKEREIVSWLFNQLTPYFEMIWWIELKDEKAVVKWWYPAKKFDPSQLKIDTHTPSFFRIVKKTKLPYHGHIVDSTAHQMFFSAFGDGVLPAHVTAMPIILQSNFNEILVGSSNQKQQDPQMLSKVEKLLEKALQSLESQRKPTQKTG